MIKDTPLPERPRERCLSSGSSTLSFRECLAILLGSGTKGKSCLQIADQILEALYPQGSEQEKMSAFFSLADSTDLNFLPRTPGVGEASAAKIIAASELAKRFYIFKHSKLSDRKTKVKLSQLETLALKKINLNLRTASYEWFAFIAVYRDGRVGPLSLISKGVKSEVLVDVQDLFLRILSTRAYGFFIIHNHPSGNLSPSLQDKELTQEVDKISQSLGIKHLGHWIVADKRQQKISVLD